MITSKGEPIFAHVNMHGFRWKFMAPSSSRAQNSVMKIAERSSLKILPSPNTTLHVISKQPTFRACCLRQHALRVRYKVLRTIFNRLRISLNSRAGSDFMARPPIEDHMEATAHSRKLASVLVWWWRSLTWLIPHIFSCDQAALQMVFSVCPSVCPSVCHTFLTMFPSSYHHEIFRSYYQWPK